MTYLNMLPFSQEVLILAGLNEMHWFFQVRLVTKGGTLFFSSADICLLFPEIGRFPFLVFLVNLFLVKSIDRIGAYLGTRTKLRY